MGGWARYRTPISGLYLCGSAAHPGGGIMGAPGRLAALEILRQNGRQGGFLSVAGERERAIVVGAGVNGLVAAFYLAREGRAPLVVERASTVGGIASTGEILPGFRASMVAPLAGPLTPRVLADTGLAGHGLEWLESPVRVFLPSAEGRGIALFSDPEKCAAEIKPVSPKDADRYREARAALEAMAPFFVRVLELTPPASKISPARSFFARRGSGSRFAAWARRNAARAALAADARGRPRRGMFRIRPLRAAIAARGIFAAKLGPRSPGTAARLLFQVAPWGDPFAPVVAPRGGMGALFGSVGESGAGRRCGNPHRSGGPADPGEGRARCRRRARGWGRDRGPHGDFRRRSGSHAARVDRSGAPANGRDQKIRHYRIDGSAAMVHLALDGLPRFQGLDGGGSSAAPMALAGRIQIGGSVDALERAFDDGNMAGSRPSPSLKS